MRRLTFTAALLLGVAIFAGTASAQKIHPRSEFISYDIRSEADAGQSAGSKYYRALAFTRTGGEAFGTSVEIPALWLDRDIYLRDTGGTGRYRLVVNGRPVDINTDSRSLADYHITPFLKEGFNSIVLEFDPTIGGGDMDGFEVPVGRTKIESLYLWSQPRIHIQDWVVSGHWDDEFGDNVVDLAIVVVNGFNFPERITLGYDIYDPQGALKDYFSVEAEIPGCGCDTIYFKNKIPGTHKFQYTPKNPALYRGVMTLRHGGRPIEYIPFRMVFGGAALWTPEALQGAVYLDGPQPKSVYDEYERKGTLIVDQAAVACDPRGGDRGPDGTIANDPSRLGEFIERQVAMYYRNRNRANIVGWSLGAPSGNGYNMYKAYEWMKAADSLRPVVYRGAEGEWNTDER